MCGICGFVGEEDAALLRRMTAALTHRGPDSDGFFSSPEASLGFRRLSIIDLETGQQPLTNEDGSLRLVLNGEIYNYRALREDLERRGHRFASRSDAEVILHLYEDEGEALLARLHGMFAFALWDAPRRRLHSLAGNHRRAGGDPLRAALEANARTPLDAILTFEQRYPLPDYQLHRVDRMTMAWGLEARVPYLDHRLVEFVNSLPDGLKLRGFRRKHLLRRALQGLVPENVLEGRKRGFGAPFRLWYSGGFRDAAAGYVNEKTLRERGWLTPAAARALLRPGGWKWLERRRGSQLFLLLTLELYCRLFVDPPQVSPEPPALTRALPGIPSAPQSAAVR